MRFEKECSVTTSCFRALNNIQALSDAYCFSFSPPWTLTKLAVISNRQSRILRICKSNPTRLILASNLHPVTQRRVTRRTIDNKFGRRNRAARESHRTEEAASVGAGGSVDVDLGVAGASNGVAGGEVRLKLAAVGAGRNVRESDGVGVLVGAAGVLVDVEVDGKPNGTRVGDAAGAAVEGS